MSKQILIVEDEPKLAQLLSDYFVQDGFETHIIDNGNDVIDWVKANDPTTILLDIMLPGRSGIDICKEIRLFSQVPILMVTAKVEEIDRLLGLELGADDYICKPFSAREVVARVKVILRRVTPSAPSVDQLSIDEHRLEVSLEQQSVMLTQVEFNLLQRLMSKPERIFSRTQLMDTMYSDNRIVNNRTIDSHIKKLRKKLTTVSGGKEYIESVYATGYRFSHNM